MKIRASDYPFYTMDDQKSKIPIYSFDANKIEHDLAESLTSQGRIHRANLDTIRRAVEADDKRRRSRALELGSHGPKPNCKSIWKFLRKFLH